RFTPPYEISRRSDELIARREESVERLPAQFVPHPSGKQPAARGGVTRQSECLRRLRSGSEGAAVSQRTVGRSSCFSVGKIYNGFRIFRAGSRPLLMLLGFRLRPPLKRVPGFFYTF